MTNFVLFFKEIFKMRNIFRHLLMPIVMIVLIFVGTCLLKPDGIPELPKTIPWDKTVHFGMFFVLSAVVLYHYYRLRNENPLKRKWIFWGFVMPVLYGGLIEMLQQNYFSRAAEWSDFAADVLGSFTALSIALFLRKKQRKSEKKLSL